MDSISYKAFVQVLFLEPIVAKESMSVVIQQRRNKYTVYTKDSFLFGFHSLWSAGLKRLSFNVLSKFIADNTLKLILLLFKDNKT